MGKLIDDKVFNALKWEEVSLEWALRSLVGAEILDTEELADEPELAGAVLYLKTKSGALGALSMEINPDVEEGESMLLLQAADLPPQAVSDAQTCSLSPELQSRISEEIERQINAGILSSELRPGFSDEVRRQIIADIDKWWSSLQKPE